VPDAANHEDVARAAVHNALAPTNR
jgi:hypothetical protein